MSTTFHNTFIINQKWLVIIGFNLNLSLKLYFCPINSNLPYKIYYENVTKINIKDITFLFYFTN